MKWSEASFGDKLVLASNMLAGINLFEEQLTRRGIDDAFETRMKEVYTLADQINNNQEEAKGELKRLTEQLNGIMDDLGNMYMEAKKIVKMDVPQSEWKKFGIDDER
jgi:hypothetical protein